MKPNRMIHSEFKTFKINPNSKPIKSKIIFNNCKIILKILIIIKNFKFDFQRYNPQNKYCKIIVLIFKMIMTSNTISDKYTFKINKKI